MSLSHSILFIVVSWIGVLSSLGLLAWFRHACFEYHAHVRLLFRLAVGLGEPWTRDGDIPQGCLLSMMFIVALYLPWCKYLAAQEGVEPQLYADNLKCVSRDPGVLLRAARLTSGYVRLVGQELADLQQILTDQPLSVEGAHLRATLELDPVERSWNKAQAIFVGVMRECARLPRETFDIRWVDTGLRVSVSAPRGPLWYLYRLRRSTSAPPGN